MANATSQWFAYLLTGDETAARTAADAQCQQIAQELGQGPQTPSNPQQGRFFTIDLFHDKTQATWNVPHAPQLVNFPLDPDALALKMNTELQDLYAIHGSSAIDDLASSIQEASQIHQMNLTADPPVLFTNPTKFTSLGEILNATTQVLRAHQVAWKALSERIASVEKTVQATAADLAQQRLTQAANEIIAETARYIEGMNHLNTSQVAAALQSKNPASQTVLNASGVAPLIGALRKIATRAAALAAASGALADKVGVVKEQYLLSQDWVDGIEPTFALTPEQTKQMFPAESGKVEDAARELEMEIGAQCRALPLLYRIWKDNNIPDSVTFAPLPTGEIRVVASTAAGGQALTRLVSSIHNTLVESYAANLSFAADLRNDTSLVWRYPPLIDAALSQLQYLDPSVEFQAAQERLASESGTDVATSLSMAAGAVEGAATLLAAAPEVLLVLAAITLVADVVSSVVDFRKNLQAERAFHSVLDPSRAPASDPSYIGVVINIVATLLDVKGFADAARTAQYARRAGAAQAAVEVITQ